jgi:lipoprotein-anchoring transpeptidase ErfK/SrfK
MSARQTRIRVTVTLAVAVAAATIVVAPAAASPSRAYEAARADDVRKGVAYPASAVILGRTIAVRTRPSDEGRTIAVLPQFRKDFRPTVLQVLGSRRGASGVRWVRISVPGRPNGRHGWVRERSVHLRPVTSTLVVDLSARKLRLVEDGRTRFATRVAVGKRGAETPTGLFYLTAVFVPTEKYLGAYAFETSAYSKLSDWPGGGIVGLHGTTMPQLLGKAISHGCVRMSNAAARVLRRHVTAGTPLRIVP